MITIEQFFMGRDKTYASELTDEIKANAQETVRRVNKILARFYAAYPKAHTRGVNSGWRPPVINANTKNAAVKSHHMTGKAVDIGDDDELLDTWLMSSEGQKALVEIGLWMESPKATPRWAHLQIVPPRSGRRVFIP